jgi:hypothetical protein
MGRFRLYEDCTYKKFITINDKYYEISVPYKAWEGDDRSKVAKHIEYWIRRKRLNKKVELKYGNVKIIDELPDESILRCSKCDKTYTCRSGIVKHIRNVHMPSVSEGELMITDLTNPRTTIDSPVINNNITNNITNNINNTINIALRPFGEENPKWLTAELLHEALQNLNGAIPRLLQEKHFNDSFPENQNIQISDIRHMNKRLRVYEKSGWRIRNREKVLRSAMDKAYDLLYDAVHDDGDDSDDEDDEDETKLSRREIRRLHNSRRARRTIERALRVFDEFRPYTTPNTESMNDEVDTMLLDRRERERTLGDIDLGDEIDAIEDTKRS